MLSKDTYAGAKKIQFQRNVSVQFEGENWKDLFKTGEWIDVVLSDFNGSTVTLIYNTRVARNVPIECFNFTGLG